MGMIAMKKKKLKLVELVCSRCGIVGKALPSAVLLYCSKCGNGKGKRVA